MNSYGLPLIFKAVNVETGEEWEQDYPYMIYSGTKKHKIALKPHHGDIALLQQTGFTDAAGKDVYFGDVLIDEHSRKPYIVQMNDDQICALIVDGLSDPVEVIYPQAGGFGCLFIIGNCYEPPSLWLERAREIWPNAQLPELAEGVRKEDER